MGRLMIRPARGFVALTLVVAACGGGTAETTTTTTIPVETTTTTSTTSSSTTTTTLPPGGPPMITEGDNNETVAAFQWLLNCNDFATLTADGNYGASTRTAIDLAQTSLGRAADGSPDEETFALLSRTCDDPRPLTAVVGTPLTVIGNAASDDGEVYLIDLTFDTTITLTIDPAAGLSVALLGSDGLPIEPTPDTNSWPVAATGPYQIVVAPDFGVTTFSLLVNVVADAAGVADWLLTTTGIAYKGTKLSLGDAASPTIDKIFDWLDHGVRGGGEFDTGWAAPGQEGIRGISIEGFRFLFFGPNVTYPTRPQTLVRIRVLASTTDAEGNPRPVYYVTTPQGIGPGHTRAQLLEVYPGVSSGKNGDGEFYYRLTNSGGELCFYFGETEPTDTSPILEMSTECR